MRDTGANCLLMLSGEVCIRSYIPATHICRLLGENQQRLKAF